MNNEKVRQYVIILNGYLGQDEYFFNSTYNLISVEGEFTEFGGKRVFRYTPPAFYRPNGIIQETFTSLAYATMDEVKDALCDLVDIHLEGCQQKIKTRIKETINESSVQVIQ